MNSVTIKAPAKINLYLEVIKKRPDGYHDIRTIMQSVDLFDIIHVAKTKRDICIESSYPNIPLDERNTAYKAAKIMQDYYKFDGGLKIAIEKNIPIAAGLGGGSSDAAAVLKAINFLYDLKIDDLMLSKLGKEIGADVPYCVLGGTVLAEGIGDRLTRMPDFKGVPIVIVKPDFNIETRSVFSNLNLKDINVNTDLNVFIENLYSKNISAIGSSLYNQLEIVVESRFKQISQLKKFLLENGAIGSLMTGSGPSVFAIFEKEKIARQAADNIAKHYQNTYLLKTC
jgi:4-diphosphocytidyl-2-C-methyl-D-erythritol kinase